MTALTPLEQWLKDHEIPAGRARTMCAGRGCAAAFDVLMRYPFTLPKMALTVAKVLDIPAEDAAPMGRALSSEAWTSARGLAMYDSINLDPEWWRALTSGAAADDACWLNVVAFRSALHRQGINSNTWISDHPRVWARCRNYSLTPVTRRKHICDLAQTIGVPEEELLTRIPDVTTQLKFYGQPVPLPAAAPTPGPDAMSWVCKIDPDKVEAIRLRKGLTMAQAGQRYCYIIEARERTEGQYATFWDISLRSIRRAKSSSWATAGKYAYALECRPEDVATRLTKSEAHELFSEQKRKNKER